MAKHHGKGGKNKNLLSPTSGLSGRDLRRAARALTAIEFRPQISAYRRLVHQLRTQNKADARGLTRLGLTNRRDTGQMYRALAKSEQQNVAHQNALGGMLNQQSSAISNQGAQNLAGLQGGVAAGLQQGQNLAGGPPGGGAAQQQLAQMVATQNAAQVSRSQAQQGYISSQANAYSSLAGAMAGSAQMQGAEARRDMTREMSARVAESRLKGAQSINEARGKLADTKALKGASLIKNLLDLRKQEQDYSLGAAATKLDAAKLAEQISQDKIGNKLDWAKLGISAKSARASMLSAKSSWYNAHHSDSSSSGGKEAKQIWNVLGQQKILAGLPGSKKGWAKLEQYLLKQEGISNAGLVNKIVNHVRHQVHHHHGGGHHGSKNHPR